MKRREFLAHSIGVVVGTSIFDRADSTPCPPPLVGATSSTRCGAAGTILEDTAASLSSGGYADVTANTTQKVNDVQWQVETAYYDPQRREVQYMGKPASSQSREHSHYHYSEETNTWTDVGVIDNGSGHIWCCAFDPVEGEYYFAQYGSLSLYRFRRRNGVALSSWETTAAAPSNLQSDSIYAMILGWHPNLFGPGKPGVYAHGSPNAYAYNPASDTWHRLSATSFDMSTSMRRRNNGTSVYLPGPDMLCIWGQSRNTTNPHESVIWVEAGAGLSTDILGDGLISTGAEPPVLVRGKDSANGHVVAHPGDPNRLLLLEEGSGAVYDSIDYGATWNGPKSYTHPFTASTGMAGYAPQGTIELSTGVIQPYGVVMAITSGASGGAFRLWKPND